MKTAVLSGFLFLIVASTQVLAGRPSIIGLQQQVKALEAEVSNLSNQVEVLTPLADQECPAGFVVTGTDGAGGFICAESGQQQIDDLTERVEALEAFPVPPTRFSDNFDGTVRDNLSGLVWTRDANCINDGAPTFWVHPQFGTLIPNPSEYCAALADGGCGLTDGSIPGDWQLPSLSQIDSLMDDRFIDPAFSNTEGTGQWVQGDIFWNIQFGLGQLQGPDYWTSTSDTQGGHYRITADRVGLLFPGPDDSQAHIWCVKGN